MSNNTYKKALRKAQIKDKKDKVKSLVKAGVAKDRAVKMVNETSKDSSNEITYEEITRSYEELKASIQLATPAVNEFINAGIHPEYKDTKSEYFKQLGDGIKVNLVELENTLNENDKTIEDFKTKAGPITEDDIIDMYNVTARITEASNVLMSIQSSIYMDLGPLSDLEVFKAKGEIYE